MLFWLSLVVALAAVVGAGVFLGMRALALWRQFKATSAELGPALERVTASADAASAKADALGGASERLDASLARLAESRARLRVLAEAWSDVSASIRGFRSYVPREKKV